MLVLMELRRQGRQIIASIFGVAVIGYFAFHAVEGERGLRAYFALNLQTELAREERDALRHGRMTIESRVNLLKPESLNLDMLDERARTVLNKVHEDDFVVLLRK
ncbi:MAG: septum formation initiator family protein [Alphaproteobacteria bacterium]|nr:septum formation initiator family protein [Alphaproteobacteria bacterium]MCK5622171.1 septum formation initiator family protein [Alphaproteobacteria bacterium]